MRRVGLGDELELYGEQIRVKRRNWVDLERGK
jgi:hypothetical protein